MCCRKVYFSEEIDEVRKRNYEEAVRQHAIMAQVKETVAEAKSKTK
jgi:hypothetical protein